MKINFTFDSETKEFSVMADNKEMTDITGMYFDTYEDEDEVCHCSLVIGTRMENDQGVKQAKTIRFMWDTEENEAEAVYSEVIEPEMSVAGQLVSAVLKTKGFALPKIRDAK